MNLRFLSQLLLYTQASLFLTLPALASIQVEALEPTPEAVVSIQVTDMAQSFRNPLIFTDARSNFDQMTSNQDARVDQSINQDMNQDYDFNRDGDVNYDR